MPHSRKHLALVKEVPLYEGPRIVPFVRPGIECPICKGAGWLRTREEYSGKTPMVKCAACAGDQAARRQADMVAQLFGGAHFPFYAEDWTFDTYPHDADQDALAHVRDFVAMGLSDHPTTKRGLYLCGLQGRGKTGLAISALKVAMHTGHVGLFITALEVMQRFRASMSKNAEESPDELLQTLTRVPWLALDDLATERPSDYVLEQLYSLIEKRRAAGLYTIFTSNLGTVDLEEYWRPDSFSPGKFHAGIRIVERIRDYCMGVTMRERNLRGRSKES